MESGDESPHSKVFVPAETARSGQSDRDCPRNGSALRTARSNTLCFFERTRAPPGGTAALRSAFADLTFRRLREPRLRAPSAFDQRSSRAGLRPASCRRRRRLRRLFFIFFYFLMRFATLFSYSFKSSIFSCATPVFIAASATRIATRGTTRGSNGFGITYVAFSCDSPSNIPAAASAGSPPPR